MNGNIGKEFPDGKKFESWAQDTWKKYVSKELREKALR